MAPWLAGALGAVLLLGPVLGPGPVLTLDLVLLDPVPVPRGVWGLGPELPRRVPLWLPVAWLAPLVSGELLGKLVMAGSITAAFVGARRLALRLLADRPIAAGLPAAGAGALYAASPFLLTRLAVGHLMVVVPMAVLPWVLPRLLQPARSLPRTFLAALALGLAGHAGGLYALVVIAVGLALPGGGPRSWRRAVDVLAVALLAQLPWLVPGLVVGGAGSATDATPFTTELHGLGDLFGLVVGHGFWQPYYQVGQAAPVALLGVVVTGLAAVGLVGLPPPWRARFVALAAIGLGVTAASALPGTSDALAALTRLPGGGVLRESQRLAVLALVVVAPCAALGAAEVAGRAARVLEAAARPGLAGAVGGALSASVLATAIGLAYPAVWGIDPRLAPVEPPAEWAQVQAIVGERPGTVLALPWHQWFDLAPGGGRVRRVLNPVPFLVGGDVLLSSDPELDQPERRERRDPREETADAIVAAARDGQPVSERLARLGVRWVLVLHAVDWADARGISAGDPGLRAALRAPTLDLWEVPAAPDGPTGWEPFPVTTGDTLARPYAPGWLRGLTPAGEGPGGTIALPEGSGPVWYWPALLVLAADALTVAGTMRAVRARRAERLVPPPPQQPDGSPHGDDVDWTQQSVHPLLPARP